MAELKNEWTDNGVLDEVYHSLTHNPCGVKTQTLIGHRPVCPKCEMLNIALACIARGWHVFPCWPKSKMPMISKKDGGRGWKDATLDAAQIREWWTREPNANVAIACGPSNLCVVDIDYGLDPKTFEVASNFDIFQIPATYAVRTGRRPGLGLQLYYSGTMPDVGNFNFMGCTGQIKSAGGYVMAAGSIHPDSKERYELLLDKPLAELPEKIRALKSERQQLEPGKKIAEGAGRHDALMRVACGLRARGLDGDAIYAAMVPINPAMCEVPISDEELKAMCYGIENRYPAGTVEDPVPVLGDKVAVIEPVKDWRLRYMTQEAYRNIKPPEFLIDGFLVKQSIAMLAGPVSQRKTIVALNIAHSLCTGEPLFGFFNVTCKPARVVYLCPEMGAASFVKRIKQIRLGDYIGNTFFIQTMSQDLTALDDLDAELPGAVVFVDTITRFIDGDENSSEDMRLFAKKVFRLVNAGASVVLLHHSKKGSSGTLDDGLRGSSELAAFVDSCWITELEDPREPYKSLSKMRNQKQRDFECDPFKLKPTPASYFLTIEGEPAPEAVLKSKANDAASNALAELLAADPKTGINRLQKELKARGYSKGVAWVTAERARITSAAGGAGVPRSE